MSRQFTWSAVKIEENGREARTDHASQEGQVKNWLFNACEAILEGGEQ